MAKNSRFFLAVPVVMVKKSIYYGFFSVSSISLKMKKSTPEPFLQGRPADLALELITGYTIPFQQAINHGTFK